MLHGHHIYAKAYDTEKETMCAYPQSYHVLTHCKFVLQCCAKCPSVNFPDQEIDAHYLNTSPSIHFHVYHIISRCITHVRIPLTDKKFGASVNRILLHNNQQKYTREKS